MKILGANHLLGDDVEEVIQPLRWLFQAWTQSSSGLLLSGTVKLNKGSAGATGGLTITIQELDGAFKPDGVILATATQDIAALSESPGAFVDLDFDLFPELTAGSDYGLVIGGDDGADNCSWRADSSAGFAGGHIGVSVNGGVTWNLFSTIDFMFSISYDDGVHRIPTIQDFSWQDPVRNIQDIPPV